MDTTIPENMTESVPLDTQQGEVYYIVDIICLILQFMLIIPIILGNSLVLRAIHQFERLQSPTNVFLGSLAISDLLVGIITTPAFALIHNAHLGFESDLVSCVLSYNLAHSPVGVSMITLFAIAIERFIAVHCPFFYKQHFTVTFAVICAMIVWLYVWITIPTLSWTTHKWSESMNDCNFASVLSKRYIIVLLTHMLLILVVTTCLYLKIGWTAHKHHVAIRKQEASVTPPISKENSVTSAPLPSASMSHNAKLAKMLATVLGVFYLSWVPYFISLPFAMTVQGEDPLWLHVLEQFAGIIVRCNAFMNPIVYAWKNKEFNQAFRKILKGKIRDTGLSMCDLDNYGSIHNSKGLLPRNSCGSMVVANNAVVLTNDHVKI